MPVIFPPLESATPEGLLAVGGAVDVDTLLTAYQQGIFPWPISRNSPLTWFSPDPRGVLDFAEFHVPKSFIKFLKKSEYHVSFNKHFDQVIENCALVKRKHEKGTWISKEIINGYIDLFNAGHAYSVEVYKNKNLIGGLYGVCIGEIISGESMFHLEDNASKLAFYTLINILKRNGITWIDTQMVTPVISSFGGSEISRNEFIKKLKKLDPYKFTRDQLFEVKPD